MANEQNLRPQPIRTKEEAKRKGRAGGIASGAARRENKRLSKITPKPSPLNTTLLLNGKSGLMGRSSARRNERSYKGRRYLTTSSEEYFLAATRQPFSFLKTSGI